uniref:Kinase n=1 Tax=Hanusia phi TaxID=3032 RepID=A0A7S0EDQ0_9CRYP
MTEGLKPFQLPGSWVDNFVMSFVASGHEGAISVKEDDSRFVFKRVEQKSDELQAYETLPDELKPFCPKYFGSHKTEDEAFLMLQNLVYGMKNPHVMDIKMGTRTFLETEVLNEKRRMDLLAKMVKIDPNEPTEEEKQLGITKLRYMQYREKLSTSQKLGFRIDAIKIHDEERPSLSQEHAKNICDVEGVHDALNVFLCAREDVKEAMLTQLKELRNVLETSEWFMKHEIIGSSILFVFDK